MDAYGGIPAEDGHGCFVNYLEHHRLEYAGFQRSAFPKIADRLTVLLLGKYPLYPLAWCSMARHRGGLLVSPRGARARTGAVSRSR